MVKIYCDGAATMKQVNGKYERCNGGWAFARVENNKVTYWENGRQLNTTNNAMELFAILSALWYCINKDIKGTGIEIYCDSAYCVNIFSSWIEGWKRNGWTRGKKHEPIENVEIIKEIDDVLEQIERRFCTINWVKVKGHNGNEWNEYVDKLAVKGKLECAAEGK
jgi:ribonuclease HI